MRVHIIGPNLIDQSKGSFHVHKEGCADTRKREYSLHREDTTRAYEVKSQADVVTTTYDPGDFEYDENTDEINGYLADIWFAPCVDLPAR